MFKLSWAISITLLFLIYSNGLTQTAHQQLKTDHYHFVLRNLNPQVGSWYLLSVEKLKDKKKRQVFHIEVPDHLDVKLQLHALGLGFNGELCPLWDNPAFNLLTVDFDAHSDPYYPICDGSAYIRLSKPSNTKISSTESISRFLRRNLSSGERIINMVKPYIVSLSAEHGGVIFGEKSKKKRSSEGPANALVRYSSDRVPHASRHQIGIELKKDGEQMAYGQWYPSKMHDGIYASLMIPEWIDDDIKKSYPDRVHPLTASEADKLVYLIAYDLDDYQVEYVAGLEQPGLREPSTLHRHLVPVGNVPSYRREDTVAVFIGGFQQRHGRINRGPLKNRTYGYMQNGVIMDKLSDDLATFISTGSDVDIVTWPKRERSNHPVVSARQNGVPLIENGKPHRFVNNWGFGNWSGDSQGRLQSLRSAICIQNIEGRRFMIFAAFTSATPSSMAKTLQSYQCESAMHLDMNAYMYIHNALINYQAPNDVQVEYLHREMEYPKGLRRHRYILDNNERDFFYVYRR